MNPELAHWLVSDEAAPALAAAMAEADPGSLAAATRLRRDWTGDQAAAVLAQAALRRKAAGKFGDRAKALFFTPDGLEQATRAEVAAWRATRFVEAGVPEVVDLGCGLGADALAFADAGLAVIAVEADPVTAVFAAANLAGVGAGRVLCGDAVALAPELLAGGAAVFIDPARRTASGRTWQVGDFSPPWDFAVGLLQGRFGCVKAAPGLPSALIPEAVDALWVSHRGDLVETSLWSSPHRSLSSPHPHRSLSSPHPHRSLRSPHPHRSLRSPHPHRSLSLTKGGARRAVLLPAGAELDAGPDPASGPLGDWLYEPDPAVIRARAVGHLAEALDAHAVSPGIAYLTGSPRVATPFATAFEVLEVLPYTETSLRAWVHDHGVGVLEIKTRGIDVDPAVLRRKLKPKGKASATLVLTPTPTGAKALVVRRAS